MTQSHPNFKDSLILFADLQLGIADLPLTVPGESLGKAVAALAKLGSLRGVPTLVSTVQSQAGDTKLIAPLEAALGEHILFVRSVCDSAQEPAILEAIEKSGRKKILISGVATEIAVSLPAYTLQEKGFEVFVVVDATAGLSPRTEEAVHKSLVAAGVKLTTIASLAGVFAEHFSDPLAMQAIGILYSMAEG